MRFFGRKKEPKSEEVDLPLAILRNKEAIETLEKRQSHVSCRIRAQEEEARQRAVSGDKRGALFSLKRKKMLEKELEQLGNAHLTLEQQIITLESAQTQQVAVGALAAGVTAQKALNQHVNLRKMDEIIEEMQEQAHLQNELAQILNQGVPIMNDEDLLAELHILEVKRVEEALADAAPVPNKVPGELTSASCPNDHITDSVAPPSDEEQLKKLLNELC